MTGKKSDSTIQEIDCLEAIDNLYAYLDGELQDREIIARFEAHLDHCHTCYSRAEMEKALNNRMVAAAESEVPESLRNRLHDLIDKL
ncbi:MAG: zf-HC2 domain-containing protein [Gammaproteobacteria bacterium]|jgi:anti-sigma factor (TIGR02949 family)